MATNLFAPLSENTKKDVLVEFKAGRMNFKEDGTKTVEPDKRKGLVQIKQSADDNIIHFIWKDRTTGTEDINLMLFPEDASFRKVNEANGRVYVLEWTSTDKKMFFWIQEPKDDKDKEHCDNINKYINNPPQPSAGAGLGELDGLGLNQQQLLQLLGGNAGPFGISNLLGLGAGRGRGQPGRVNPLAAQARPTTSTTSAASRPAGGTTSTSSTTPAASSQQQSSSTTTPAVRVPPQQTPALVNNGLQLDTLQQLLSEITQPKEPSLKDIINVDEILASGLFDRPEVVSKLAEFLPEGQVTAENLRENIRSPQFQQAVSMFNQALRTGQLAGIMSSFGLDASSVGQHATIEDFLRAIQKKAKEEAEKEKQMDTSD
jgi:hypothetical protein